MTATINYFEYFSEIEERFTARRGSLLLLSTLDWALIETWRDAGIPLVAVLRGIDQAFDNYEARKTKAGRKLTKVNGLAWCAQAVMEAAAEMAEASIGGRAPEAGPAPETGFEVDRVSRYLETNATLLSHAAQSEADPVAVTAQRLRELATSLRSGAPVALDELDRTLTVLEEKLQAGLLASVPEAELLLVREAAERELAPYRGRLGAVQMRQLREQFVQKRLLETRNLPRLSIFYMPLDDATLPSAPEGGA